MYPVDVIPYMIDAGIVVLDDIKLGLRPCRTDSTGKLQKFAEIMRACVREACKTCRVKGRDVDILETSFLLRFIGWMNMGGSNCVVLDAIHVSERRTRWHNHKDYIP